MIYPANSLKLWCAIFAFFGLCLMASSAFADVTSMSAIDSKRLMNRQLTSSVGKNHSRNLPPEYFSMNLLSEEFTFEGDERLLEENNSYSYTIGDRVAPTSLRGKIKLGGDYFKDIFTDAGYAASSPSRWEKSDWVTASIMAGFTGVFFLLDDEIKEGFQDVRNTTTDDLSAIFERFGNGTFTIPALAGLYLYGRFGEDDKIERTALLATESFLVSGLFSTILKVSAGRHRPSKDNSADIFDGPSISNKSFPSGHTTTAFSLATVVSSEYDHIPLIAPISYGLATLTGFSRLNDNKHWASDVFFGAALGYFTSKTLLHLHSNKKGQHFMIYPRVDRNGGGIVLGRKF